MANLFEIQKPIWNGGKRCVGVNADRLNCDFAEVNILYKDKTGKRIYPQLFNIKGDKAKTYPVQEVAGGVRLHVIPIKDLSENSISSQIIAKPARVCFICGGQEYWTRPASQYGGEEELCCRCHPKPIGRS